MQPTSVDEARGLSGAQLDAIAGLERRVVAHDGGRLKLEWGALRERPPREVNDLLAWESGTLVGYCGIYAFGGEPELAGAVDPARRRGGIGSALLARALEHVATRGRSQVLLVTPSATPSGRRFAQAKGASLHHSEHHLTLPGPPRAPVHSRAPVPGLLIRVRQGEESDRTAVLAILQGAFGTGPAEAGQPGPRDVALVAEQDGAVVGTVRLDLSGGVAGVYGLAVRADLRGGGIGRALLFEVCLEARRRGARTVTLEVETDNDRALGLYTSVGFERRTTEDYFALPVSKPASSPAGR